MEYGMTCLNNKKTRKKMQSGSRVSSWVLYCNYFSCLHHSNFNGKIVKPKKRNFGDFFMCISILIQNLYGSADLHRSFYILPFFFFFLHQLPQ